MENSDTRAREEERAEFEKLVESAREFLRRENPPLKCTKCGEESNFGPMASGALWLGCQHVYEFTLDPDSQLKSMAKFYLERARAEMAAPAQEIETQNHMIERLIQGLTLGYPEGSMVGKFLRRDLRRAFNELWKAASATVTETETCKYCTGSGFIQDKDGDPQGCPFCMAKGWNVVRISGGLAAPQTNAQDARYKKALEAIANDPIIGKETLDTAANWYRQIASEALRGLAASSPQTQEAKFSADGDWDFVPTPPIDHNKFAPNSKQLASVAPQESPNVHRGQKDR